MSSIELPSSTNGDALSCAQRAESADTQQSEGCNAVIEEVRAAVAVLQRATESTDQPKLLTTIAETLAAVERTLSQLDERVNEMQQRLSAEVTRKEWYSVAEAAQQLGKSEFTVREWCRLDRVNAHKRETGRGGKREWMIAHAEIERIRNKGLLPQDL